MVETLKLKRVSEFTTLLQHDSESLGLFVFHIAVDKLCLSKSVCINISLLYNYFFLGMVAQIYNPSIQEAEAEAGQLWVQG
jgi:hypothetical protein